jgi:hypothetical protein
MPRLPKIFPARVALIATESRPPLPRFPFSDTGARAVVAFLLRLGK